MATELASVDSAQVDAMMERLQVALSPAAFIGFLVAEVEPFFLAIASENFGNEGDRSGQWEELAETTQTRRQMYGFAPAHPINQRTGELHDYVMQNGIVAEEPEGASWTWPPTDRSGVLDKKYQTAQGGRNQTPARPIVEVTDEDFGQLVVLLEEQIMSHMEGVI